MTTMVTRSIAVGVGLLACHVATARAQTAPQPLNANFRCAGTSATCPTSQSPDGVRADGVKQGAFDFAGYRTYTTGKGKTLTTFYEGAFVGIEGGIEVNLVSEGAGDRTLVFRFGPPVVNLASSKLPADCNLSGKTFAASQVEFRMSAWDASGSIGLDGLQPGETVGPNTPGERWAAGKINFTISANATASLFFNYTNENVTPWDGLLSLSRSPDGQTFVLTSTSAGLLRCTYAGSKGKGTQTYYVGTFDMPFELTVTR